MCSILKNRSFDKLLEKLVAGEQKTILERMYRFADAANETQPGPLENSTNLIKYMPVDLQKVKKHRVGRHRVYYTGNHTQCSYRAFYVKANKKSDKDQEGSKRFQKKLGRALDDEPYHLIPPPE